MSTFSGRMNLNAALLLASLTAGPCLAQDLEVAAEVWPSVGKVTNAPEKEECAFLRAGARAGDGEICPDDGHLATRPSFGVAFSGGGTRSASATLGQLRALRELGLDRKLHYISAVSGGSWAAVPYTFLPEDLQDAAFLGPYTPPEKITNETLESIDRSTLGLAIARADLAPGYLRGLVLGRFDENYGSALDNVFLRPFGLGDGKPPRFITFDERSLGRILARNPELAPDDFYTVRSGRPFLIVGGAVVPLRSNNELDRYPFDMTPLYVGTPVSATVERSFPRSELSVGGGYVEAFAYDGDLEDRDPDSAPPFIYRVEIERSKNRFSLSDVIATSGAAPVDRTAELGFVSARLLGFPQYEHWPVDARPNPPLDYLHGDGGLVDNVGLMPLLARGVENILVFVNTREAFQAPSTDNDEGRLYADVVSFFRAPATDEFDNVVFEDGEAKLRELRTAFAEDKELGRPLVHCDIYSVRENARYNIYTDSQYAPHVCWIYLDATQGWFDRLPRITADEKSLLADLVKRQGVFARMPHYKTFFENLLDRNDIQALLNQASDRHPNLLDLLRQLLRRPAVVKLRPEQVAALADLATWTVCESVRDLKLAMEDVFGSDDPHCTGP